MTVSQRFRRRKARIRKTTFRLTRLLFSPKSSAPAFPKAAFRGFERRRKFRIFCCRAPNPLSFGRNAVRLALGFRPATLNSAINFTSFESRDQFIVLLDFAKNG